jgi:hypothetical protein
MFAGFTARGVRVAAGHRVDSFARAWGRDRCVVGAAMSPVTPLCGESSHALLDALESNPGNSALCLSLSNWLKYF